jgi:hypothetical protein
MKTVETFRNIHRIIFYSSTLTVFLIKKNFNSISFRNYLSAPIRHFFGSRNKCVSTYKDNQTGVFKLLKTIASV